MSFVIPENKCTTKQQIKARLAPEVNRISHVRNFPFKITAEELYGVFGKYGAVCQIRLGDKSNDERGTAFVTHEDMCDTKATFRD